MVNVNKKIRLLLLPGAYNSPAARFRIWNFVKPLEDEGYEVDVRVPFPDRENKGKNSGVVFWQNLFPRLSSLLRYLSIRWILRDAKKYDFIITNRDIVPEIKVQDIELRLISKGCKLIFDFDDSIHLGDRLKKLNKFLPSVYHIVAGNEFLADYARTQNHNVSIIPTVVDTKFYRPVRQRIPGVLRIGWSGSSGTNIQCLPLLQKPLEMLAKEIDFEFIVISDPDPKINWKGVNYRFIPWCASTEVEDIHQFDIGLMPLADMEFEKGKCGAKAIQYMGIGIPALVSPVGVNAEIVSHGKDGYHCLLDEDWVTNIYKLAIDKQLRLEMGKNAFNKVCSEYSVNSAIELWKKILIAY